MDFTVVLNLFLGIMGVVSSVVGAYYQRASFMMQRGDATGTRTIPAWWKSPAISVMLLLCVLNWVPFIKNYYFSNEFSPRVARGFGIDKQDNSFGYMETNGRELARYADKYRLVAGAFYYDGTSDIEDVEMDKSATHRIQENSEVQNVRIKFGDAFMKRRNSGARGINLVLLLVPMDIEPSQFSTVRQAKVLGSRIIFSGSLP